MHKAIHLVFTRLITRQRMENMYGEEKIPGPAGNQTLVVQPIASWEGHC